MYHHLISTLAALILATAACAPTASSTAAPDASSGLDARSESVREVAMRAYQAFADGWATGDFSAYVAMLAPSMEFSYPLGTYRGHVDGTEGYDRMIAKLQEHIEAGHRLTLEPPMATMIEGARATVLFESHGSFGDYEYRAQNVIVFTVSGDRITGFREFLGDVEPTFVCGG